jgi:gamma-glutamylcyclotransferase (GGCT)/AIG2-like uncharacterized protein YtfP
MGETCRHLFVYGTLMAIDTRALGRTQRARLQRESRSLGAATMTGARLYNLGRYPGLVESDEAGTIVHGEVVALANPARTFSWLDAYEGVIPDNPDASDYARLERTVRIARGTELTAWVYVFLRDIAHRRAIAGGRW